MLASKRDKRFRKPDKARRKASVLENFAD